MTTSLRFCKGITVLISMIIVVSSCSIKGYKPIANSEEVKATTLHIFDTDFNKALYKTSMVIYGNNITGLTLIKKTDSAYRVVSMSELGIKYFDFEFPFDRQKPTVVHYIMEPLNKKLLIDLLDRDFRLLFFCPDVDKSGIMVSESDSSKMIMKHNRWFYLFNSSGEILEIAKQRSLKQEFRLYNYSKSFPGSINIDHGKIDFDFELVDR